MSALDDALMDIFGGEQRKPPSAKDIKDAVKRVQAMPDAGDHGHVLAVFPMLKGSMPAVAAGKWSQAKQVPVKLSKLRATNAQLNRDNLIWHLQNPGKSRFQGQWNTHPQIVKTSDGQNLIVDGHHRLSAEFLLGLKRDVCWRLKEKNL